MIPTRFMISDTHFGHDNMLTFISIDAESGERKRVREFSCVEEVDELMVKNWNDVVRPIDTVYHIGDVAMKRPSLRHVNRLNGHKRLILGNHDIFDYKDYLKAGFQKFHAIRVLDGYALSHIPIHPESLGRFKGNFHGHIHERRSPSGPYLNLSVERINYTPIAWEDAVALIPRRGDHVEPNKGEQ